MFNSKRGMMDDFLDLVAIAFLLVFGMVVIGFILDSNVSTAAQTSLEGVDFTQATQFHLYYLQSPVVVGGVSTTMRDVLLGAVNSGDAQTFELKTKEFFTKHELEGSVVVYESDAYNLDKRDGLFVFSNTFFAIKGSVSNLELENPTNEEVPRVTVVITKNE